MKKKILVISALVISSFVIHSYIIDSKNLFVIKNAVNEEKLEEITAKNNNSNIIKEEKTITISDIPKEKIFEIKDAIVKKSNIHYNACNDETEGECKNYYNYKYYIQTKIKDEEPPTYKKIIVDYRTLCRDGEYSPSNAKGRGACSHHGGVADWNAPVYGTEYIPGKKAEYSRREISFQETQAYKLKYDSISDSDIVNYYMLKQ